jgi:uncharacterized protein
MKQVNQKRRPIAQMAILAIPNFTFFQQLKNFFLGNKGPFWLFLLLFSTKMNAQMPVQPPSISVSGLAEIKVVPDEICTSMAIETRDADLGHAKLANDTRAENAVKYLKQNGVKSANIQTGNISVRPEFEYNPETGQSENVKFYVVTRQLEFKLTNPDKFDDLVTGLVESGVNYVNEVRFNSTKIREHRDEARRQAVRAAREKATLMTNELGAKLGKVILISEGFQDYNPVYQPNYQNTQDAVAVGNSAETGALSVGMISISANVNVTFLIE